MSTGPFKMRPQACPICGCGELERSTLGEATGEFDVSCQLAECGWVGLIDTISEPGIEFQAGYHLDVEKHNRRKKETPGFCPMCTKAAAVAQLGGPGSGTHDVTCREPGCGWRGVTTTV